MNKIIFFFLCCLSMAAQTRELEVYFENGSFSLDEEQTRKLSTFIASLPVARENLTINIAGHTDNVGELAYNAVLSENRANAVATIFKNHGFADSAILTSGRGEVHPVADNRTEAGKAKNRRARIVVSDSDSRSLFKVENIGGLKLTETRYVIDAGREQNLNYRSGTKINIPKNAFVDQNGQTVKGKITIRYIEYRDPIDFMLSNISMEHGGHFNSGGMFKILAYQGNRQVFLKDGQKIDIDFRLTGDLPNMGFYEYDTISRTWAERSRLQSIYAKMCGGNPGKDEEYRCPTGPCVIYQMLTFIPQQMIRFGGSAHDNYLSEQEEIERKMATNHRPRKGIRPEALSGTEYPSAARAIEQLENRLIASEQELKKTMQEIAKTPANYSLVRLSKGNKKHKFKIFPDIPTAKTADLEQTVWTYKGALSDKVFDQKWLSCVISGDDDHYVMSLKTQSETLVLKNVKMKNKSVSNRDEQKLAMTFNKNLESQSAKLEELENQKTYEEKNIALYRKKIERIKAGYFDEGGNDSPTKCFWQFSRQYMPENERAMFAEEWLNYFDANKQSIAARHSEIEDPQQCLDLAMQRQELGTESTPENLIQSLQISNLGIHNCDQVRMIYEPLIADVGYRDKAGNTIRPTMIYVVDSKINGILRYDAGQNLSPNHFPYGSKSENTVLAFVGKDSYIVNKDSFKKAMTEKARHLTLVKIEKINNKEQLETLF